MRLDTLRLLHFSIGYALITGRVVDVAFPDPDLEALRLALVSAEHAPPSLADVATECALALARLGGPAFLTHCIELFDSVMTEADRLACLSIPAERLTKKLQRIQADRLRALDLLDASNQLAAELDDDADSLQRILEVSHAA